MMRKHKLKTSVFAVASTSLLFLSATAFNAAAAEPPVPVEEEEISNYLSVPAIFAEGYGLGGLPAVDDRGAGLPGSSEASFTGNVYCYNNTEYYFQLDDTNSWQAEWNTADGFLGADFGLVPVTVDWSDEVINTQWNDKSVIPIGVSLTTDLSGYGSMSEYQMKDLTGLSLQTGICLDGDMDTSLFMTLEEEEGEVADKWGTNSFTKESDTAGVYSVCARLTIQKYDDITGQWVGVYDSAVYEGFGVHARPTWYSATIDGPGKIVYLYNWNLALHQNSPDVDRSGKYRLTFSLDDFADYTTFEGKMEQIDRHVERNTMLLETLHPSDALGVNTPVYVSPTEMYVEIDIIHLETGEE
ncbi:MAG: hypothetical protein KKC76_02860 [Proteobacteria bacterium]|nr:hypothetical protein [Pseudomonadota bacterium]MBU4295669.1 hypothetical protein [Pseudomonadota bacterium]MCG2746860.1 hypothetical protein [Desulfobulbaceae bacterium]